MKSNKSKSLLPVLTSILLTLSIYTGTLVIFLYASGWRIDFSNHSVRKTGVLTVESSPTLATIEINDETIGRTSKSTALNVGTYSIKVSKEGYYDWIKDVTILEEKSTPVFPWLILSEIKSEIGFSSDKILQKYWIDDTDNHLLLLLKDETRYELLHYDLNTQFWELGIKSTVILSLEDTEEGIIEDIDLLLSHSGEFALLNIVNSTASSNYIIPTNKSSEYKDLAINQINLSKFSDYDTTWSLDNKYLILESKTEVLSYDFNKGTKSLLLKKTNPLDKWITDKEGFFYIVKHLETSPNDILKYALFQYKLDGSSQTEVIPTVYFQNNTEYIENYRSTGFDFSFFTNSPECTQTIGEITDFYVNQSSEGVYIQTTQSTYWYDIVADKYITVSPYPVQLIAFSPDNDKLLLENSKKYEIFTFDKENGDHTVTIGTKDIGNLLFDQIEDISWISNSSYISFKEDNFIYIADKDGDNKTPLISSENIIYWTITRSRDELITLTNITEDGVQITVYTIH
ncbi:PEGA domain-containing protein [bacterium]|nr:PEGA domain-containing protein [bacterium]